MINSKNELKLYLDEFVESPYSVTDVDALVVANDSECWKMLDKLTDMGSIVAVHSKQFCAPKNTFHHVKGKKYVTPLEVLKTKPNDIRALSVLIARGNIVYSAIDMMLEIDVILQEHLFMNKYKNFYNQ